MSKYGFFGDTPNQIRNEGQEITLTRTNTGPNSVRLDWNIPDNVVGCGPNGAYDGIVLTVNRTPSAVNNAPVDTNRYTADPTGDADLHAGDTLNGALVIGAFYGDATTTELHVADINNAEPYYFSAYAVTKEYKYHNQGVHAYEQPYGKNPLDESTPGYHIAEIGFQASTSPFDIIQYQGTVSGIRGSDVTGLRIEEMYNANGELVNQLYDVGTNPIAVYDDVGTLLTRVFLNDGSLVPLYDSVGTLIPTVYDQNGDIFNQVFDENGNAITQMYDFTIKTESLEEVTLTVNGENAVTFDDLIIEINNQLALVGSPLLSAGVPFAGGFYYDQDAKSLFVFDGVTHGELNVINNPTDPATPLINSLWFNPDTSVLNTWTGSGWAPLELINYGTDFTDPQKTDFWFNGTVGYGWEGATWCERTTVVGSVDPSLPPELSHGTYWFDTEGLVIKRFKGEMGCWQEVSTILNEIDPNTLPDGYYWYDDSTDALFVRNAGAWDAVTDVTFSDLPPATPFTGQQWYDVSADTYNVRNLANDGWDSYPGISWDADPTSRMTCGLWWNSTDDNLYVWNVVDVQWELVNQFTESAIDPSLPVQPDLNTLWFNGSDLSEWDGTQWINVTFVNRTDDPTSIPVDTFWFDETTSEFKRYDGSTWTVEQVTEHEADPYLPNVGDYWYNETLSQLNQYNGVTWVSLPYSATPLTPDLGFQYYDTLVSKLLEWNGTEYIDAQLLATAGLNEQGNMIFLSKTLGSESYVCVGDVTMFSGFDLAVRYDKPRYGTDSLPHSDSAHELGIGTDGSSDERRELIDTVRAQLGYPTVEVELTKQQFDLCVDGAIETLRKRSGAAYKHSMFFMDLEPGVQVYELTSSRVGFNKIVDVMACHRVQSSFLGNAHGQGAYGQAMLQHMYQMGSFDLVSYHLVSEYVELMQHMFATHLLFNWNEAQRKLSFYQTFGRNERILVEASVERTEQELINDRTLKTWVERYTLGSAKIILAQIRGKYSNLPGAGGGVGLNAGELEASGQQDLELCWQQIDDFVIDQPEEYGYESTMLLG